MTLYITTSMITGPSWPWSYGSWIYNYLCIQCLSPLRLWVQISIRARCTTSCYKVCQWLATGRWFSPGPPVSSTNKTDRHDISEISYTVDYWWPVHMFNENTKYYTHTTCTWFRERNNQIELRFVWTILYVKIISCKKLGACWKISGLKISHPLIYWSGNITTKHIYLKAHGAMSRLWYWLYVFNTTFNSTLDITCHQHPTLFSPGFTPCFWWSPCCSSF